MFELSGQTEPLAYMVLELRPNSNCAEGKYIIMMETLWIARKTVPRSILVHFYTLVELLTWKLLIRK